MVIVETRINASVLHLFFEVFRAIECVDMGGVEGVETASRRQRTKRPSVLLRRLFGPEQANLRLLGSPYRAVDCAQGLDLVVIVYPVLAGKGGRGFIWTELRGAIHCEGHHLTGPRG